MQFYPAYLPKYSIDNIYQIIFSSVRLVLLAISKPENLISKEGALHVRRHYHKIHSFQSMFIYQWLCTSI